MESSSRAVITAAGVYKDARAREAGALRRTVSRAPRRSAYRLARISMRDCAARGGRPPAMSELQVLRHGFIFRRLLEKGGESTPGASFCWGSGDTVLRGEIREMIFLLRVKYGNRVAASVDEHFFLIR